MIARKYYWIALGAVAYLIFLLNLVPATTAHRLFAPSNLRLAGIQGTLWSGSASLGSVGAIGLHEIQWRLRPWALPLGRVRGEIQTRFADGFVTTNFDAALGSVKFRNLRASASLEGLQNILPLGGMEGSLSINFTEFESDYNWPATIIGEVRLGELAVPPLIPVLARQLIMLGDYVIRFSPSPNSIVVGHFEDEGGPLEVLGMLRLTGDREYAIEGNVRARANAPLELSQGLNLMTSPPDASGQRTFFLNGSL